MRRPFVNRTGSVWCRDVDVETAAIRGRCTGGGRWADHCGPSNERIAGPGFGPLKEDVDGKNRNKRDGGGESVVKLINSY